MCYVFSFFRILDVRAQFVLNFQVGSKLKGRPQKREAAKTRRGEPPRREAGTGTPGTILYIYR